MAAAESTYFPDDGDQLAEVADFLDAYREKTGKGTEPQFFLSGSGREDHIQLPANLYEILVSAVHSLRNGMAGTIHPTSLTITTQDAAELLGVSRPTVVRLIESGRLPAQKVHRHRRIQLTDVIEYRDEHRDRQLNFIAETSSADTPPSAEEYREVRAAVVRRRREARTGEYCSEPFWIPARCGHLYNATCC